MKTTFSVLFLSILFTLPTLFAFSEISSKVRIENDYSGPCNCEKGWNFTVHQITDRGCREKSIYCVEGVKLEPGYSCGTCPKPCSTCEEDEEGKITICKVRLSGLNSTYKAKCKDLQNFFRDNGKFNNSKDHCGPCTCADENDKDTDNDGICDRKDGCPENAERQMCIRDRYHLDLVDVMTRIQMEMEYVIVLMKIQILMIAAQTPKITVK